VLIHTCIYMYFYAYIQYINKYIYIYVRMHMYVCKTCVGTYSISGHVYLAIVNESVLNLLKLSYWKTRVKITIGNK
jgi:hypothetical protein